MAAGPVAALIAPLAGVAWGGVMLVAAAGGLWIATGWLMGSTGLFISPVFPGVALAFSFIAITLASFFLERGRARQTRETMLEELRKSEADLRAAQERAKLGSWELDLATQTGSWSTEMFRLFNCDPARGAPTPAQFLGMVHPEIVTSSRKDSRGLSKRASRSRKSFAAIPCMAPCNTSMLLSTRERTRMGGLSTWVERSKILLLS
jgi:hypothetical protein